jgi:thiol-disulfide isomerase/thioredoxin
MMQTFSLRRLRAASVSAAALALMLACCSGKKEEARQPSREQTGRSSNVTISSYSSAPDVELKAIDGSTVRLSSYRGNIVVLSLLATWNTDCARQVAELNQLQKQFRDAAVVILGVFTDKNAKQVLPRYVNQNRIGFPVYYNGSEIAGPLGGMPRFPTTYIIIRDGNIYERITGFKSARDLEDKLKEIMMQRL